MFSIKTGGGWWNTSPNFGDPCPNKEIQHRRSTEIEANPICSYCAISSFKPCQTDNFWTLLHQSFHIFLHSPLRLFYRMLMFHFVLPLHTSISLMMHSILLLYYMLECLKHSALSLSHTHTVLTENHATAFHSQWMCLCLILILASHDHHGCFDLCTINMMDPTAFSLRLLSLTWSPTWLFLIIDSARV